MLARYTLYRGRRPAGDQKPEGVRQLTTHNSRHCLRPTKALVDRYLGDATDAAWRAFRREYLALVRSRRAEDPAPFDALAELARREDVYLGCWCPTRKNPDVTRCHTALALRFMKTTYPDLDVREPSPGDGPGSTGA